MFRKELRFGRGTRP